MRRWEDIAWWSQSMGLGTATGRFRADDLKGHTFLRLLTKMAPTLSHRCPRVSISQIGRKSLDRPPQGSRVMTSYSDSVVFENRDLRYLWECSQNRLEATGMSREGGGELSDPQSRASHTSPNWAVSRMRYLQSHLEACGGRTGGLWVLRPIRRAGRCKVRLAHSSLDQLGERIR
jgi:hypothetical protein